MLSHLGHIRCREATAALKQVKLCKRLWDAGTKKRWGTHMGHFLNNSYAKQLLLECLSVDGPRVYGSRLLLLLVVVVLVELRVEIPCLLLLLLLLLHLLRLLVVLLEEAFFQHGRVHESSRLELLLHTRLLLLV